MSTKIEGVFPHDLHCFEDIERLAARLGPALSLLDTLHRSYLASSAPVVDATERAWHIGLWGRPTPGLTLRQQWESGAGPILWGGGGAPVDSPSWLVLGRRCLFATTGIKWWVAVDRPTLFHNVRDYFRELASALNNGGFILHRDNGCRSWDWVSEGMTFDQIEREFIADGMSPTADLKTLQRSCLPHEKPCFYRETIAV